MKVNHVYTLTHKRRLRARGTTKLNTILCNTSTHAILPSTPRDIFVIPAHRITRRTVLATAGALVCAERARSDTTSLRIAAPADVLLDYGLFLAGRDVVELRSFDGPHARRDVMELALLMREIRRQLPGSVTELVPIDSYQRALVELRAGRISALGTTVWRLDLDALGQDITPSPALLQKGDFVVGLFAAPANSKALQARSVAALRALSAVSNSDWSVDWQTLKTIGFRQVSDVKTWRQMVLSVARGRTDVMMAPFPNQEDLVLEAEGVRLHPVKDVAIALQGSRHLAAARTIGGQTIVDKVFPALASNGSLKRAYRECGFIHPRTAGWPVLNK